MSQHQIDMITHYLTGRQAADQVMDLLDSGVECVYILCDDHRMGTLISSIRVDMARIWKERDIPKNQRYGIRHEGPFNWAVERGESVKCKAISITKYESRTKILSRAITTIPGLESINV